MKMNVRVMTVGLLMPIVLFAADTSPTFLVFDHSAARERLPFSDAVLTGDTLYVAGHVGLDPETIKAGAAGPPRVPADPKVEAQLVMDAVKHTVEAAGFKMDDFVTVQVFCTDLGLYDSFNDVYRSYFKGHFPARALVGVDKLVRGAHFEVTGVAVKISH